MSLNNMTDTIAAIATAISESGIGIIRISGDRAIKIGDMMFRSKKDNFKLKDAKSHTIHYGFIVDDKNEVVDEVLISIMKKPGSYTAEDTVEINCHGGILMMKKVLELTIKNGARIAEPGEFTKRAFLNGRIDLSEAEAVMDVISSKNEYAMQSSIKQLGGALSNKIIEMRKEVLYEIAFIESALDDPEHISLDGYSDKLKNKINDILSSINRLINTYEEGRIIKEGIRTVILGKPNAGKSSLMNLLTGEEKAIVTDIAGTTRDILEEHINIEGINLNIVDTAGIHETNDIVEKIGIEKARKIAEDADFIIYIVDSSVPLDQSDEDILNMIKDKKAIILFNKVDLEAKVLEENIREKCSIDTKIIKTSTKEGEGIKEFVDNLKELFFLGEISFNDQVYLTNMRHKEALCEAKNSLEFVLKSLDDEMPEDFLSIDLMSAYSSLGSIIGEEVDDDLVNEIFSKFCMGK